MEQFANESRPRRREYSQAFKALVMGECARPGASVGGVVLSHGLHAAQQRVDRFLPALGVPANLLSE